MFWSAGCSLLRAEGFFGSSEFLYGGLGKGKLLFLIQKFCFSAVNLLHFFSSKPWIRIRIGPWSGSVFSLKCWIRICIKWVRIRNTAFSQKEDTFWFEPVLYWLMMIWTFFHEKKPVYFHRLRNILHIHSPPPPPPRVARKSVRIGKILGQQWPLNLKIC